MADPGELECSPFDHRYRQLDPRLEPPKILVRIVLTHQPERHFVGAHNKDPNILSRHKLVALHFRDGEFIEKRLFNILMVSDPPL